MTCIHRGDPLSCKTCKRSKHAGAVIYKRFRSKPRRTLVETYYEKEHQQN